MLIGVVCFIEKHTLSKGNTNETNKFYRKSKSTIKSIICELRISMNYSLFVNGNGSCNDFIEQLNGRERKRELAYRVSLKKRHCCEEFDGSLDIETRRLAFRKLDLTSET